MYNIELIILYILANVSKIVNKTYSLTMNKKKVKIRHWKTQLDTTKDTLIRINIQKTKQTKNIRGGYRGNKDT